MQRTRNSQRRSKIDQDNLSILIEKWKKESPQDQFYFRPYAESESASEQDVDEFQADEKKGTSGLLFCYQSSQQQRLLERYGNQMCLLDATYKTTRYALPLFFFCVRTNVCYMVVGVFVTQYEDADSIEEALKVFKKWNFNWCPSYFMVDYDSAEILALERVFPKSEVLLCDFHRVKAWVEWCAKIDNGVSDAREVVLSL